MQSRVATTDSISSMGFARPSVNGPEGGSQHENH